MMRCGGQIDDELSTRRGPELNKIEAIKACDTHRPEMNKIEGCELSARSRSPKGGINAGCTPDELLTSHGAFGQSTSAACLPILKKETTESSDAS